MIVLNGGVYPEGYAGDTIVGGSGSLLLGINQGSDTVTGFSQSAGDRISIANYTTAARDAVIASAQSINGNTLITLPYGSTMLLIGVARIDTTFFSDAIFSR